MTDSRKLLDAQAEWQKARRLLSWPEKLRMVAAARESILALRAMRDEASKAAPGERGPATAAASEDKSRDSTS